MGLESVELVNVPLKLKLSFSYAAGEHFSYFFEKLKLKQIVGVRCPSCRAVYLPPRPFCGVCYIRTTDWIEVGPQGVVRAITEVFLPIYDPGTKQKRKVPHTMVLVQLDGTASLLHHVFIEEKPCAIGDRVEVVFRDHVIGKMQDICGFKLCSESYLNGFELDKEMVRRELEKPEVIVRKRFEENGELPFQYTAGEVASHFFHQLARKELWGLKCKKCGEVNFPPTRFCYQCQSCNQDWIKIETRGRMEAVVFLIDRKDLPSDVLGWGLIKLNGLKNGFVHHILDQNLKVGDEAEVVFRDSSRASILDIAGFKKKEEL